MEKIKVDFKIPLELSEVKNIVLADKKEIFDTKFEYLIQGKVFVEFSDGKNQIDEELPLEIHLSKNKYCYKNIELFLEDYEYRFIDGICYLDVIYVLKGEDLSLEKFCSLNEDMVPSSIHKVLNKDINELRSLEIDADLIQIIDPSKVEDITEPSIKETIQEDIPNLANIKKKQDEELDKKIEIDEIKDEIFPETYALSFLYYRLKKGEDIDTICKKFDLDKNYVLTLNIGKEIKENSLIKLPNV